MKIPHWIAGALVVIAMLQPWSYDHRGFANATVMVPDGEISLSLDDHASGKSYCLSSLFKTTDGAGQSVALTIESVGTASMPDLRSGVEKSGTTRRAEGLGAQSDFSYFQGPIIGKLVFPADEEMTVTGAIRYKGVDHRFGAVLTLRHWEKSRKVISFCN